MPPWKPARGFGEFRDSFALTDEERQTIIDWVAAGAPQGDPADLPDPTPDRGTWVLGEPDLVLAMPQEFNVPRGKDVYRCFVLPGTFDTAQYASAFDVVPGDRKIVHHVILFADTKGEAAQLDGQDGQPGYDCFGSPGIPLWINSVLAGWAPGQRPRLLPDGLSRIAEGRAGCNAGPLLSRGPRRHGPHARGGLPFSEGCAATGFQHSSVEYWFQDSGQCGSGGGERDVSRAAILRCDGDHRVSAHAPARDEDQSRSHGCKREDHPLIYIDNWDFNWQGPYTLANPLAVKSGSTVKVSCTYNNSESNPKNPNNPIVPVGWGERTTDEMCLAFLGVTLDYEKLLVPRKVTSRR